MSERFEVGDEVGWADPASFAEESEWGTVLRPVGDHRVEVEWTDGEVTVEEVRDLEAV